MTNGNIVLGRTANNRVGAAGVGGGSGGKQKPGGRELGRDREGPPPRGVGAVGRLHVRPEARGCGGRQRCRRWVRKRSETGSPPPPPRAGNPSTRMDAASLAPHRVRPSFASKNRASSRNRRDGQIGGILPAAQPEPFTRAAGLWGFLGPPPLPRSGQSGGAAFRSAGVSSRAAVHLGRLSYHFFHCQNNLCSLLSNIQNACDRIHCGPPEVSTL